MTDGFGSITWWGFSPAVDLQENDIEDGIENLTLPGKNDVKDLECRNILLVGAGDCRHILKTIARSHRHSEKQLNFYIIENNMELYARSMLFFTLVLECQQRMGFQEKTEMFLELFGNTLVREQSMDYVQRMSVEFIKMVTDFDYLEKKMPLFDLSTLKFKERDFLEGIFKFWRNKDPKAFDIVQCWDMRVRKHLGTRYDSRTNVFDWDYAMKLTEKGAEIMHSRNYGHWRRKGVAYEIREGTYDVPNRTLASGMVFKVGGERLPRRGYWGDILVGPYIQFGIECEEQSFFKRSNKQYTSTSQDVAEYNILSLLHELTHRSKYVAPTPEENVKKEEPKTATLSEITEEDEEEEENTNKEATNTTEEAPTNPWDLEYEALSTPPVKIHFLPIGSTAEIHKKSKYHKLFDLIYLSNSMVHHLNANLAETFTDRASLILETSKFMIELNEENHTSFCQKITSMAEAIPGCKANKPVSTADSIAKFTFKRPGSS